MEVKRFYILLAIISLVSGTIVFATVSTIPKLTPHTGFALFTTALFVLFCMIAFFLGKTAVRSENKYRFIQVMLMIIMGKMTLSLFVVLVYVELFDPMDKIFIFPFLFNYIIFTAFEVYFLEKVAKEKTIPKHSNSH